MLKLPFIHIPKIFISNHVVRPITQRNATLLISYKRTFTNAANSFSDIEIRRKRCVFHSNERGMLENDLLLGTFAQKHLKSLDENLLTQYELLLLQPDPDIFNWVSEKVPTPPEHDNEVMNMLKRHIKETTLNTKLSKKV